MRKIISFIAAALMSASMFADPATVPTVQDLAAAGYDVTGKRVIALYFDEQVCNPIVFAGTYNGWETTPNDMLHFNALTGFAGWYVVEVDDASETVQGKPVQLKKDGSFSWDFQSGDVEAWINMAQPSTQTATFEAGYSGEANCTWPTKGVYIYEVAYFKNHNTPCGADKPKHNYTITAYLPEFCDEIAIYADSVRVMGGFDGWSDGIWMEKKIDEDFNDCWYAEIKDVEEGTEFKLRFGTDGDWAVQVQLNGQNLYNSKLGATEDIVLQYNGEGYGFAACAAPVEYKYTTYENWQIKYGNAWEWSDNMEKVEDGLFKLEILWEGTGFNVKSDENPIKKDWFAPEELVIGEEVIAPATVDVYLKVIDDETLNISVMPVDMNYVEFYPSDFEGLGISSTGGEISVTKNGVTVYTNGGFGSSYSLRVFKNKQFSISADRRIVKISFSFDSYNDNPYDGGLDPQVCVEGTEWEVAPMASQARISKIAVTLGDGECTIVPPVVETITVTQALEIGAALEDNASTSETYTVQGYVVKAYEFDEGKKNQSFYLSDDPNAEIGDFFAKYTTGDIVIEGDLVNVTGKIEKNVKDDKVTIQIYKGVVTVVKTAPVEYKYTTYENWQIKYGNTWEWSDNMEKVEDGLYKLEILWEGTGFNVKSDDNPIKKDWFASEELVVGDGIIAPAIVDVYLKVVDDETLAISVMPTGNPDPVTDLKEGDTFTIDNITYIISSIGYNNTVKVYWYDGYSAANALVIPASVSYKNYTFAVTEIYSWSFANNGNITSVVLPNTLVTIGEGAFYGCNALADIYSYAVNPPVVSSNTFQDVSKHCYIHVPAGTVRSYQLANVWRDFYHIIEISALPDGTTEVGVTVSNNYATFSWPVNPTASSYTLEITKNGELFCTLIFNSLGQLVGMAFAPGQGHNAPAATSTSYGYSFVVTGLTDNTTYAYTFSVRDENDNIIETKRGTFSTTEGEKPTSVDEVHDAQCTMHKVLRNGRLLIESNDATYTPIGQKVK